MTGMKVLLVLTYALASASFVGVVTMAMHARLIWPGMLAAICVSMFLGTLFVRGQR